MPPVYAQQPPPGQYPQTYVNQGGYYPPQTIQHAGLGKRFVAFLIDWILLSVINIILVFTLFGYSFGATGSAMDMAFLTSPKYIASVIASVVIMLGYFIYLEGTRQQTLGKMAMGIVVVGEDLKPIDMRKSLIRNGLRILYQIPIIVYIIDAILIADSEQRIGDKVAHTFVIDKDYFDYVSSISRSMPPRSHTTPDHPTYPEYQGPPQSRQAAPSAPGSQGTAPSPKSASSKKPEAPTEEGKETETKPPDEPIY
ncbi:MAG: RDD family protein [Thermoplasmata archaeon]|nr:RDD family protein [Thermoplasmata archaeon]